MRSLLLVDPDLDALGALASELRSRALTVVVADSWEAAAERARRSLPDAVLVAESLAFDPGRSQEVLGPVPVFVLSVSGDAALAAGEVLPRSDPETIARRVLSLTSRRAGVAVDRGDFRGTLGQVPLPDLLQLLGMNRRTGTLTLTTASGTGELQLVDGEVVDAIYRRIEGEKAVQRLLAEREGGFAFTSGPPASLRRVTLPTRELLMEGLRLQDEVHERRARLGLEADALVAAGSRTLDDEEAIRQVLDHLMEPRSLEELLDDLPLPDLAILGALERLLHEGRARRVPRGAHLVPLAEDREIGLLAALVQRRRREEFAGAPRLVVVAPPVRLTMLAHSVRRIAGAVPPAEPPPAAPVPHVLATVQLGEGVEFEVVGLPEIDAFAPLWPLVLGGSAWVVRLGGGSLGLAAALEPLGLAALDAPRLVGELDEADPVAVARLLRLVLSSSNG